MVEEVHSITCPYTLDMYYTTGTTSHTNGNLACTNYNEYMVALMGLKSTFCGGPTANMRFNVTRSMIAVSKFPMVASSFVLYGKGCLKGFGSHDKGQLGSGNLMNNPYPDEVPGFSRNTT